MVNGEFHLRCKDNTSPKRNVRKCLQVSANVLKCLCRSEKELLFLGGVVENSYLYSVILLPFLGKFHQSKS